uniref:Uracil DNA glycosylase superfamily protein n=1 Tax=uncultured marine microorganism HF4000_ANIW137G21 TaxID=455530 RepID=B3T4H0_9ZZZZ|nr:hypothetical protein ALOHA_HF4000ANIW137G21ctg1g7 [uncultured marine microorganism HF4000_ANIW137G21]
MNESYPSHRVPQQNPMILHPLHRVTPVHPICRGRVNGIPMGSNASDSLMLEICRCPNISLAHQDANHPCNEIVNVQDFSWDGFQLPEPWSGDLEGAPVLCIASNPSINLKESYPNKIWGDDVRLDFFRYRFSADRRWTKNRRVLLADGESYHNRSVAFWNNVHRQVERAYGRSVEMGVDYAMTEIVHCKSESEIGVNRCKSLCAKTWMDRIIALSSAKVLMLFGSIAKEWFGNLVGEKLDRAGVRTGVIIAGSPRLVVWLPHPNARGERNLTSVLEDLEVSLIRSSLS